MIARILGGILRGGIPAGGLWLVEIVLAEVEDLLGRPPALRDLLRGVPDLVAGAEERGMFFGALLGAIRGIARRPPRRSVRRPMAARLADLLQGIPEGPEAPGWLRRAGEISRSLLDGMDRDEAVAWWRGLALYQAMRGRPWAEWPEFRRPPCAMCGAPGRWRRWLSPEGLPAPAGWRLDRPEAFVPLCERCRRRRIDRPALARALWGARAEALLRWACAARERPGLEWDRRRSPLWPPEFGGRTWEEGSGRFPGGTAIRAPASLQKQKKADPPPGGAGEGRPGGAA